MMIIVSTIIALLISMGLPLFFVSGVLLALLIVLWAAL